MASPPATPVALYARDEGTGPVVLLLHGLGGDHTVWSGQIPALAREFRVLAPDLRGHGRSSSPPGSTFSFPEMLGDLDRVLADRDIGAAHWVGLSAGGFLALYAAVHEPTKVRSLVTLGASGHCDNHTKAIGQRWADTYRDEGFDAYALRLLKDLFYPDWIEAHLDLADQLRDHQRTADLRPVVEWGLAIRAFDLRGRVGKLRLPTLVMQGMDDAVVDSSHARLLRQTIPGAQLKLFAQTGHLVPLERPAETTEAILGFLRGIEAGASPTG